WPPRRGAMMHHARTRRTSPSPGAISRWHRSGS
ncbi:MAG: hypothetical protein AVDCRST_MAG93-3151, partial [uncultured Chloroflexia bacterium]